MTIEKEKKLRDSVSQYGKLVFNEKDQVRILYFILEDAKNNVAKDSEIYKLIAENQLRFARSENLKEAIRIVNTFVTALEAKDHNGVTVNYRKKAREHIEKGMRFRMGNNEYQQVGLDYMCPTESERAAWHANFDRNELGFSNVPLVGLGGLVALIASSAVSMFLPPLLFVSPIIALAIPIGFAAVTCVTLITAGIYMHVNRNKQVDDRYRLEFDRAKMEIDPDLYFDEDMTYVRGLVDTYTEQGPVVNSSVDNSSVGTAFFDSNLTETPESPPKGPQSENYLSRS